MGVLKLDKPIKVLVVDDSAVMRGLLTNGLSLDTDLEVVGKASDVYSARDRIVQLKPDVVTLDIQMPGMDGIEFLKRLLPQYPIAVIVVSSLTVEGSQAVLDALAAGAVDVVAKPQANESDGLAHMIADLAEKIKEAVKIDVSKLRRPNLAPQRPKKMAVFGGAVGRFVAIGASTGGTVALTQLISSLPANFPPVVIVQHMPKVFTKMFADSVNRISAMEVREAQNGDELKTGVVFVAPGDFHTTVAKVKTGWRIACKAGDLVCGHRPSVDVMFNSVAIVGGSKAVGVLLTGMGRDGADGMWAMRQAGARCFAQDEASSVVFGMPKAAWDRGAAEGLVPLDQMAECLLTVLATEAAKGG